MISIGIHIQNHQLSIVKLFPKNNKIKSYEVKQVPLDLQLTEDQRRISILTPLNELAEQHQKESCRFCFALPQNQISSLRASFPFKERFKILKTIPFEIEDKSPFRLEEVLFDIRFSKIDSNNKSDIMCFLTPKENVTHFLEFIQQTKISPSLLSTEAVALSNLIEGWNLNQMHTQASKKGTLVMYLDYKESLALFFHDKKLKHISTFSWGYEPIIESMMKRYRLPFLEAQKQFIEKAFILMEKKGVTKEQIFFSELIKEELPHLCHKLKMLKLSLETNEDMKVEEGVIMGSGSVIQNLSSFLSDQLSFPVRRMSKVAQIPQWNLLSATSHSFLIPLGLALEGLKRPPYESLNLIRSFNKKQGFFFLQAQWKKRILYGMAVFFIFTGYSVIRKQENQKISDQVYSIFMNYGKKIAFLPARKVTAENVQDFLNTQDEMKIKRQLIKDALSKPQPIDHLKTLTQNIKATTNWNLKLTFLEIKNRKIRIEGFIEKSFSLELRKEIEKISKGTAQFSEKNPIELTPYKSKDKKSTESPLSLEEKRFHFTSSFILKDDL